MLGFTSSIATPLSYSHQKEQRSRWLSQLAELIAFPSISAQPKHHRDLICASAVN